MLTIIFTRKKMLAGMVLSKQVNWLNFNSNQNFVEHQGNYFETLHRYLDQLLLTYQWKNPAPYGMTQAESLVINIVLPGDKNLIDNKEKNRMISWLSSEPARCNALYFDYISDLFFSNSAPKNATQSILFDALDGDTLVSCNYEDDFVNQLPRLIPHLGYKNGFKNIHNIILSDFEKKNIFLSEKDKDNLFRQIVNFSDNKSLEVSILNQNSEFIARPRLSESRYFDLLTSERNFIKNIFFIYENYDISKINIIFVSSFYDNPIFIDFVTHFFQKELKSNPTLSFFSDQKAFEQLVFWVEKKAALAHSTIAPKDTDQRKSFFAEIKKKCTDRKKYSDYIQKFLPKGRTIGIADDVTIWHVRNAVFNRYSLENIGNLIGTKQSIDVDFYKKTFEQSLSHQTLAIKEDDVKEKILIQDHTLRDDREKTITPLSSQKHLTQQQNVSAHESNSIADRATVVAISNHFTILKWYATDDFLQFKGQIKGNDQSYMVKVLKKEFESSSITDFKTLHEREFTYYNNVSSLLESDFGYYYIRPYLEGVSLEKYIKESGLAQKYSYDQLNSNDLTLLLNVWKEAENLPFSMPLNKNNFIVNTKYKLTFDKLINIKIVNINVKNSKSQEFETEINAMFEQLLGHQVYHEFYQNVQNQLHP